MSKPKTTKFFRITYDIKLRGTIIVEAADAAAARAAWVEAPEYEQSTSEITDWECRNVKEEP